jgi:hypothetical protein
MTIVLPGGRANAASRLIADVTTHIFAAIPREMVGGPHVQIARRVHTRCLSRYQAIGLLLAFDQPDDGYALMRGLLGDAQRLQVMEKRPSDRVALALAWWDAAVRELEDRARTAETVGQTTFGAGIRSITVAQRDALDRVRRETGEARRRSLPTEGKPLAKASGHEDDLLDYVIASDPAHGTLPTSLWHDRRQGVEPGPGETMGVVIGGNDPGWRGTVADRSTRHMVRATWAMAVVCDLKSAGELRHYADDIERRLDAEELPGSD